jgi:hypothetical protein
MKVLRRQELETSDVQVGDRIVIRLSGFDIFTATAQKITDEGVLFLFDECVDEQPVNKTGINEGGYEQSELCEWINSVLLKAFPEDMNVKNITIPTYGMLFGHDDFYREYLNPDKDEQFPLMARRKNRIADFKNDSEWYWLRNTAKKEWSAADFAVVDGYGSPSYDGASYSLGVRPVFLL